jgi:hypothetical protein
VQNEHGKWEGKAQMANQKGNPVVGIASVIGGISLCIVAVIAIFAKDQLSVAPWIVAALAIMGIALGFFASKMSKP